MLYNNISSLIIALSPDINCSYEHYKQLITGAKDMGIFNTDISLLNKFLQNFASCFSKKQFAIFTLAIYVMFKDYKRNSLYEMAKIANTDYQKFQYFFSDSKWNLQSINNKRLALIENQLTSASTNDGILAIDDTGCPKPYAKKTQGAKWQYCGPLKRNEVCNVAVASCFVSKTKHFPIDVIPYLPESEFKLRKEDPDFKDKIQIAKSLVTQAVEYGIKFSAVNFDSWYASSDFLEHLDYYKKLIFFTEIKSNRNIFMFHPGKKRHDFVRADELVTLINKYYKHKKRLIKFKDRSGNEVRKWTFSFKAKLKDCKVQLKFVVVFGKWNDEDDKNIHVLISNKLNSPSKSIILNYLMRWGVEHCFKELKDTFCFDQYQVRHIKNIERYWNLCLIAWTLTYWIKQNAYLNKIFETTPDTLNQIKKAINSLLEYSATNELSKNDCLANNYFKIKSARFKKKAA